MNVSVPKNVPGMGLVEKLVKRVGVNEIKVEPYQIEQIGVKGPKEPFDAQEILREQMKLVFEA